MCVVYFYALNKENWILKQLFFRFVFWYKFIDIGSKTNGHSFQNWIKLSSASKLSKCYKLFHILNEFSEIPWNSLKSVKSNLKHYFFVFQRNANKNLTLNCWNPKFIFHSGLQSKYNIIYWTIINLYHNIYYMNILRDLSETIIPSPWYCPL